MRAIWKGAISFGLVNIPVGLYSATRPVKSNSSCSAAAISAPSSTSVSLKRMAERSHGSRSPRDTNTKKGEFVVVTEEDFKRVEITSNQTVDIKEFVELEKIDPMFFDQPYFLAPEKGGAKAYVILREALKQSNKVGIAKVVIKTREHLAAVKPLDEALVLELMHFR